MKKIILALLASGVLLGCAQQEAKVTAQQVKTKLLQAIPGLPNNVQVDKGPIKDMYQVVIGRKVFYTSADGNYLIFGNIVNATTKENLTEKKIQELGKIDWNKLPLDLAIKVVNGNGSHKIAVFSDPDCPYCHIFEQQTAPNLKDTTIYTFLFPLPIHPNAASDSKKIWCSKDRAATWVGWMRNKKALPNDISCDTSSLDKVYKFATDVVQVDATPTIVLQNGNLLSGALPANQLIALMDQVAKN